jgi:hypothetical protein
MIGEDQQPVHADFKMIEREKETGGANMRAISGLLRAAWALPKDTYVTQDIPILLTLLCLRETPRERDRSDTGRSTPSVD